MKLKPETIERLQAYFSNWELKFLVPYLENVAETVDALGKTEFFHCGFRFTLDKDFEGEENMIETNHDLGHAPKHYEQACAKIEPREFLRYLPFQLGNACKYILRYQYKGHPLEDMKKALDYLQWASEAYEEPISEKVFVLAPYFENQILDVLFNVYEEPEINYDDAIAIVKEQISMLENGNED